MPQSGLAVPTSGTGGDALCIAAFERAQLAVQRPQADTQDFCGSAFIIICVSQDQPDISLFYFAHLRAGADS